MAKLVLLQDGANAPYAVKKKGSTIGRHPDCEIQVDSNMVSRQHARVFMSDGHYVVEDLKSGNGTFINGQKIESPAILKHDDRLNFGPILFRFEAEVKPPKSLRETTVTQVPGDSTDAPFRFDIGGEGDDKSSTIMGSIKQADGFGLLDVQPGAKLKAVLEITRSLVGTVDVDKLLPKILDSLFDIFPGADRGCILVKDDSSAKMLPRAIKHRRDDADDSVKLSRTILNKVLEEKTAILSADAASDDRFDASESISSLTIRSMMCAPLLSRDGEPLGIINIDTQNPLSQFKQEDLDIMIAVAGQAALAYESARLMSSYVEKQKQDNEMDIARGVQHALLPEEMPEIDGYEFFASYDSAQAVGGDYYDIVPLKSGKICLAFGDVAGKGVPAALVVSRMASVVRSTLEFVEDPLAAIEQINPHMCDRSCAGRFVTFLLIVLDPMTGHFTSVNAGHMSPMIRKPDGTIREYAEETVGVPIGVVDGYPFEKVEDQLEPGDTVLLYTDGVSEAMNPAGELYGLERIRKVFGEAPGHADDIGEVIREDVRAHADGRAQNDDITMMVFGRNSL